MNQSIDYANKRRITGNIFKGSVGNLIEWYDWYVYSAFAVYFSEAFFPKGDPTSQLLNTAAIFAVGFLMRPLGSLLMGRYADRHGRRAALTLSITVMAGGSLIIALTPSYATIGVMAPAILVLARLLQGLSLGGEYGTSATYLSEMASSGRRGFYSSFQYVTLVAGQLLALGVQIILQQTLSEPDMNVMGLAYSIRHRSNGCVGRIVVATYDGRIRAVLKHGFKKQVECRDRSGSDETSKGCADSSWTHTRRNRRFLYIYDVFTEVHGEYCGS